eukprot:gene23628-9157_t
MSTTESCPQSRLGNLTSRLSAPPLLKETPGGDETKHDFVTRFRPSTLGKEDMEVQTPLSHSECLQPFVGDQELANKVPSHVPLPHSRFLPSSLGYTGMEVQMPSQVSKPGMGIPLPFLNAEAVGAQLLGYRSSSPLPQTKPLPGVDELDMDASPPQYPPLLSSPSLSPPSFSPASLSPQETPHESFMDPPNTPQSFMDPPNTPHAYFIADPPNMRRSSLVALTLLQRGQAGRWRGEGARAHSSTNTPHQQQSERRGSVALLMLQRDNAGRWGSGCSRAGSSMTTHPEEKRSSSVAVLMVHRGSGEVPAPGPIQAPTPFYKTGGAPLLLSSGSRGGLQAGAPGKGLALA